MNGPDTHGLTGESSAPDREDITKGTAVKDTISIGRDSAAWEWRFMFRYFFSGMPAFSAACSAEYPFSFLSRAILSPIMKG